MHTIMEYIDYGRKISASDIHIKTNQAILYRCNGQIQKEYDLMTIGDIKKLTLNGEIQLTPAERGKITGFIPGNRLNIDTSCHGDINCRINIYSDLGGINLAIRLLPEKIPTMQELRLPQAIQNFAGLESGLIITSGPTGSGKTSTLAAILNEIATTQQKHIITIEEPIEYRFTSYKSIITQREVGIHTASFADGLREALRQDPDIILVGEMRDAETMLTAMQAAETGHLVFTTLHAGNVIEAIDRFSQYFPAEHNNEIRAQLANCLQGVVAQKLLKAADNSTYSRVAAFEILLPTDAIKNTIRTGKSFKLKDYMSHADGMMTMEESISGLKNKKLLL